MRKVLFSLCAALAVFGCGGGDSDMPPFGWTDRYDSSSSSLSSSSSNGTTVWYCVIEIPYDSCYELAGYDDICVNGGVKMSTCPFYSSSSRQSSSSSLSYSSSDVEVDESSSSSEEDENSSSSSEITSNDKYCIFASAQYCILITTEAEELTCTTIGAVGNPCPPGYTISGGSSSSAGSGIATTGNITFTGLHTTTNPTGQFYFIGDTRAVTNTVAAEGCTANANSYDITTVPETGVINNNPGPTQGRITGAGTITATPYATCNGEKTPFPEKAVTVTVAPSPVIGDCGYSNNFFRYMGLNETILADSIVTITDNYDRCTVQINVTGIGTYYDTYLLSRTTAGDKTPTARVTCTNGPAQTDKNCPVLTVADRHENSTLENNQDFNITQGSTVISLIGRHIGDNNNFSTLACWYDGMGTTSVKLNGTNHDVGSYTAMPIMNGEQVEDGLRILIEKTDAGNLRCQFW